MSDTTFSNGTVILPGWLNEVNESTFTTVNLKWPTFGAVGDGVTNDTLALQNAIIAAAGKTLVIPAGTYLVTSSAATLLSIASSCNIVGAGIDKTIIVLKGTATYFNGINVTADLNIENLTIKVEPVAGQSAAAIRVGGNNLYGSRVKIDGQVVHSGSFNFTSYGLLIPTTGSNENIVFENSIFTRLHFPFLKQNGSTSTQKNINYVKCIFDGNFREDLSFNSPLGEISFVKVHGCHFKNHAGNAAGVDSIYVALASVKDFSVTENTFEGTVREAIHMEETCLRGVCAQNNIKCAIVANGAGIAFLENNVTGSMTNPENIVVSSNTIHQNGTAKTATTFGVWIINNISPELAGSRLTITSNIVSNFDSGFAGETNNGAAVTVSNNLSINCAKGYTWRGATSHHLQNNVSDTCDIGVETINGGTFVRHRFVNCTTNATATTAFPVVLVSPVFEYANRSYALNETVNHILFPLAANSRVHGFASTYLNSATNPRYASIRSEVTFDGATTTVSSIFDISPSSIDTFIEEDSGNLRCRVFTSFALSDVRLTVWFDGHIVLSA
jgi:hypothetical protein